MDIFCTVDYSMNDKQFEDAQKDTYFAIFVEKGLMIYRSTFDVGGVVQLMWFKSFNMMKGEDLH